MESQVEQLKAQLVGPTYWRQRDEQEGETVTEQMKMQDQQQIQVQQRWILP